MKAAKSPSCKDCKDYWICPDHVGKNIIALFKRKKALPVLKKFAKVIIDAGYNSENRRTLGNRLGHADVADIIDALISPLDVLANISIRPNSKKAKNHFKKWFSAIEEQEWVGEAKEYIKNASNVLKAFVYCQECGNAVIDARFYKYKDYHYESYIDDCPFIDPLYCHDCGGKYEISDVRKLLEKRLTFSSVAPEEDDILTEIIKDALWDKNFKSIDKIVDYVLKEFPQRCAEGE